MFTRKEKIAIFQGKSLSKRIANNLKVISKRLASDVKILEVKLFQSAS